jgi:hypothetical protein
VGIIAPIPLPVGKEFVYDVRYQALDDGTTVLVYANAITAVGTVRSRSYATAELPLFPDPGRFEQLLPHSLTEDGRGGFT